MSNTKKAGSQALPNKPKRLTDTNLLLLITIVVFLVYIITALLSHQIGRAVVFLVMYIGAMIFLKKGVFKASDVF